MSKFEEVIDSILKNVSEDRDRATAAANDITTKITNGFGDGSLRDQAISLSKHIEALQRSNDQLIKTATLIKKSLEGDDGGFDLDNEEVVLDLIEKSRGNEG